MTKLSKAVVAVAVAALTATSAFATIPAQTNCSYVFNTNMKLGMRNADVMNLQKVLNMDARTQVSASGVGSAGQETMYFGNATFAAVKKFQSLNGVAPVSGYAATLTRGVLNQICTTTGNTSTTTTSNVSANGVSVAANSIPVGVLVSGQSAAKIADFVVNANGTVTGLELMRTGISNNDTLKNVYLYDGATRLTDASSVLTDGTIRFTNSYGLFPVSGSKTLTVRADIGSVSGGQTVGVAMKSVTLMGATSSTPVTAVGPLFSVASADVSTVTFNGSNTVSSSTVNAGTVNYNVWGASFSVGTRAANLKSLTVKQIGSAPMNTLSNVRLIVDGVQKATGSVNSNGMVVFDLMSNATPLNTGSHTVEVRADVTGGAYRSFYMSLENQADLMIEDSTLPGVFVTAANISNVKTAGNISINKGNITVAQDPAFTATKVVGGTTNATIGKFVVRSYGEDVKITQINVTPTINGTILPSGSMGLKNLTLFVNGGQIGSTISSAATGTASVFNLGSQFIVAAGTSATLEVRADMINSASNGYTSGNVSVNLDAVTNAVQGISSSELSAFSGGAGQSLSISSSAVTFAATSGFNAQTVSPNTPNTKIGSFTLQAQNTEDIRVSNITVGLGGTAATAGYSNLRITDGTNVIGVPTASNQYTVDYLLAAGQSKTVEVFADINSAATGTTIIPSMVVQYRGVQSNLVGYTNSNVLLAGATTTVNTATVNTPTLVTSSNPVSQYVVGGTTQNVTYNVTATGGTAKVTDLGFTVTGAGITKLTIAGVDASVVGTTAQFTGLNIDVPNGGAGKDIPVTITYNTVNDTGATPSNTNATLALTSMTSRSGNVTTAVTPSVSANLMTLVASKPTLTVNSTTASGLVIGENKIGEVTVAADANGNIKLQNLFLTASISGIATSTLATCKIVEGTSGSIAVTGATVTTCSPTQVQFAMNGYSIAAGTSKTFSIYATIGGTLGNSGTSAVSTKLDTSSTFTWDDVNGGTAGLGLTGAKINNYPTNSYTVRN